MVSKYTAWSESVENRRKVSKIVAKVMPLFLLALFTYSSYVLVIKTVGDYQITVGSTVAVLVVSFLALLMLSATFVHMATLLATVTEYIVRGSKHEKQARQDEKRHGKRSRSSTLFTDIELNGTTLATPTYPPSLKVSRAEKAIQGDYGFIDKHKKRDNAASQLRSMTRRDYYLCQENGYPPWCSSCLNWKEDRAHHCSEVGRCVRRMDHFCPWVGGVIGEATFKFFVQFTGYSGLYCLIDMIVMTYFLVDMTSHGIPIDGNVVAVLALSALFGLFSFGMLGLSIPLLLDNQTTVENIDAKSKIRTIAVLIPERFDLDKLTRVRTITWPSHPPRTYAILHTRKGENPYDIGKWNNVAQVMGNSLWEWFLPITLSPLCRRKSREEGYYPMNEEVLNRMRKEAGLPTIERD